MHVFRHPKYYTELRKRNKSDQAISNPRATAGDGSVRPGPGLKPKETSCPFDKTQAGQLVLDAMRGSVRNNSG